jgi:hypothetical protein
MAKAKGYTLVPRQVPARQRSSFYKEIVTDFLAGRDKSVMIEGTDRKSVTLVQGLRKVLETDNLGDVKVVQRGGAVYLTKA